MKPMDFLLKAFDAWGLKLVLDKAPNDDTYLIVKSDGTKLRHRLSVATRKSVEANSGTLGAAGVLNGLLEGVFAEICDWPSTNPTGPW